MKQKILCVMLLIIMLLTTVMPVYIYATDTEAEETDKNNKMETNVNNLTVQGSNSFGRLLATELDAKATEQQKNNGCNVFSIRVENSTAVVEFETQKEATIIVGVYDEQGMQLKTSGTAKVGKEDKQTLVELEQSKIPTYFYLKVFMIDNDMNPLCSSYESSYYTKDMQDFLKKTTDDFAEEKVLNLDNDKTTNYAIYNDKTKIIKQGNYNTIKSINETDNTYVFENIDDSIRMLQVGDIFSYEYTNGEVLIVKVSSININNSIATVNGANIDEIKEVFDYLRIDGKATTEDCEIREVDDEGVTYNGLVGGSSARKTRAKAATNDEHGGSISRAHSFSVNKEYGSDSTKIKISGEIENKIELGCAYYETEQNSLLEVKLTDELRIEISISGEINVSIPIAYVNVPIIPGLVSAEFTPAIALEASGKIALGGTLETVIGFRVSNGKVSNISSWPDWSNDGIISGEIKVFIGLSIELKMSIISDKLVSAGVELRAGAEFSTELKKEEDTDNTKHLCKKCIEGEINGLLEFSVKVNFLAIEEKKTFALEVKLCDCYYSIDNNKFGFTKCPYKSYKVIMRVQNQKSEPVNGAKITGNGISEQIITDRDGFANCYLKNGSYQLTVNKGNITKTITILVNNDIVVQNIFLSITNPTIDSSTDIDITTEKESKSGKCGDNVKWTLYESGLLYIEGSGKTYDYNHVNLNNTPWKDDKDKITKVKIGKGITKIGTGLFYDTKNLTDVIFSDDVEIIGFCSFQGTKLKKVVIPEGVTTIEGSAFSSCYELEEIILPKSLKELGPNAFTYDGKLRSVEIPKGITRLENHTFFDCYRLEKVVIPNTVKSIGIGVFSECDNLSDITIPNSVTTIEPDAFSGCKALSTIMIPNSVTKIYSGIFEYCENLRSVTLPNTIEEIPAYTFESCYKLTNITIPSSVKIIGRQAFSGCKSLITLTIPSSVTTIKEGAFYNCEGLTDIYFKGNKPEVIIETEGEYYGRELFGNVTANAHYPSNWTSVLNDNRYGGNITWIPYHVNTNQISKVNTYTTQPLIKQEEKMSMTVATSTENEEETINGEKTANYTNLIPEKDYVLLVVKHKEIKNILSPNNLLYIAQKTTDKSGNINFTYIPKEDDENAITIIYGPSRPQKISLVQNNTIMKQGESRNLIAMVIPNNAIDSKITWKSNNESIVKVENNGRVTAVGSGTTEIIASTSNGLTATCIVTVEKTIKLLNSLEATLSNTSFTYTGKAITPSVIIKDNGTILKQGIDYTIAYQNNINSGTANIKINGIGNYTGSINKSFTINKKKIDSCTITKIANQNYTGGYIKPKVTVKNGNNTLRNGIDYTISYKNNKNLGTATLTVTGKGNYTGSIKKTFKIIVPKIAGVKASAQTTSAITVKWNKPSGKITGYEVYMATSKNGKYKKIATIKKNKTISYKKARLSAGKTYYFKVRAYTTISGKKKYGSYSTILPTGTKTKTPTISKITAGKKKATIKWKKVSGASGYEIYMATSKKGTYKKVGTTTKNNAVSYTENKLTKGKKYYFKVRTYKKVDGKKIYSSYSSIKNIKAK